MSTLSNKSLIQQATEEVKDLKKPDPLTISIIFLKYGLYIKKEDIDKLIEEAEAEALNDE